MKHMRCSKLISSYICVCVAAIQLYGQAAKAPAQSGPDVLVLSGGGKLFGQLENATGASLLFKTAKAGEVTVDWKNVQDLRVSEPFAVVRKDVMLRNASDMASVPQGTITLQGQNLQVKSANGATQMVPLNDIVDVVPEASFQKAFQRYSFAKGWTGGATLGISLTEATQTNQTVSAALNMTRTVPQVTWMSPRRRTTFDFNDAYGNLKSPGAPAVKTSLLHASAEQDWFLSPRLFAFANAAFDHSYSQGLQLQQTYGGGLGFIVFKTPKQEFDVKVSGDYIDQRFDISSLNKHLVGSIFGETYTRTFAHGILLNEQGGYTPAWNDMSAYSAFASIALTFPVYHHFGFTLGALDNFLNDPPPGFKKNSFQFTAGATYSF